LKYYAVTDDPNELMHYGVKGMKWGQHIFGDKPKSPAYRRAASKLSASMRNGIAKAKSNWKAAHSPAVMRAKAKAKAFRKEQRAFRRDERKMNKVIQRAREGRLRYGKLTDDQVRRVTERLALEQRARQLGSTEKPKFRTRMKEAIQEGMLQGTTRGGAAYIEETWRGKGRLNAQRKYGAKIAKSEARAQRIKNKQTAKDNLKLQNKMARKEAQSAVDKQFYKDKAEAGDRRTLGEIWSSSARAKVVSKNAKAREEKKLNQDLYKKYLMGGKNDSAESMVNRINDTATRDLLLGTSSKKKPKITSRGQSTTAYNSIYNWGYRDPARLYSAKKTRKPGRRRRTQDYWLKG